MKKLSKLDKILIISGFLVIVLLAIILTPLLSNGLFYTIENINKINLLNISFTKDTLKVILIFSILYFFLILIIREQAKNYRKKIEYGSANWGDYNNINKKYEQIPFESNKILTEHISIGYDAHKHRRNLNTIVVGGSGAGKTRFYAKPNVMQANTSFVILDPKGEIKRDTGYLLEKKGYKIKILDLINMDLSYCYNPFVYIKDDNDVQKLVTNLFKSTTPKGAMSQDPFWDTAAEMLLLALMFYLKYEAPEDEQNFPMIMEMLRAGEVKEDDDNYKSPLDMLFMKLEDREPEHIAVKYYHDYHSGAAKTLKSIQITLASRLEKFNLDSLARLTQTDELDLESLGEEKTALFAIIPDNDTSFNFLVSILYTQIFQSLFYLADHKYQGSLPVHVHFLMDEFANVHLPDDFEKILSTMRSRNVSVSIILQNLAQLKALFEKQWESIVGNCDEFLYLGGNEQSTHKYVSELLGKETIDTNTFQRTYGTHGSYSTNYQNTGRELLTPDEVRMLNNEDCILFIRGEKPILDKKYNLLNHPNINLTPDGRGKPYIHGLITDSIGELELTSIDENTSYFNLEEIKNNYEVVYSEDMDKYLERRNKVEKENESKENREDTKSS